MKEEFDKILQGIKVYTDFLGYNMLRQETGPQVGNSPFAVEQRFDAYNAELIIYLDKSEDTWRFGAFIKDPTGADVFKETWEGNEPYPVATKKIQDILSLLPRYTRKAMTLENAFLEQYVEGMRNIIVEEYNNIVK